MKELFLGGGVNVKLCRQTGVVNGRDHSKTENFNTFNALDL